MNEDHPLNVLHTQAQMPTENKTPVIPPSSNETLHPTKPIDVISTNNTDVPSKPTAQETIEKILPNELKSKPDEHVIPIKQETPQQNTSQEPSSAIQEKNRDIPLQKPIRTYESDIAEALAQHRTSVTGMVIAENKRAESKKVENRKVESKIPEIKKVESRGIEKAIANNPKPDLKQIEDEKRELEKAEVKVEAKIVPKVKEKRESVIPLESVIEPASDVPEKHYFKQILLGISSVILVLGGIAGGYYLYEKSPLSIPAPVPQAITIPSVIPADKQVVIDVGTMTGDQIIAQIYSQIAKNTLSSEKILEVLLAEKMTGNNNATGNNTMMRMAGSTFIDTMNLDMPDMLKRSLKDTWMFGAYMEDSGDKTPFMVFTTDFFQNTFAGMLAWEVSMPDDLSKVLNYSQEARAGENNASTTIDSYFGIRGKFVDKEIRNRDVREFVGTQGQILFMYSFIDKNTLLFTTTETALAGLIDRVEKQTYVR